METIITTFTTADKYQHYLPLYIYVLRKSYPRYHVQTFINGRIDDLNKRAFKYLAKSGLKFDLPIEDVFGDIEIRKSTANCLRFLIPESYFINYKQVIITDADLLIFNTDPSLLEWHKNRMRRLGACFAGHRGPLKRKYRPEISPEGWRGDFARVAGGFFMATPRFFKITHKVREKYLKDIRSQKYNDDYREADEVMLGRILKESGLQVPKLYKKENFDIDLRGVHLGDFKGTMKKRYASQRKMRKVLTQRNCKNYLNLLEDPVFQGLVKIMKEDHKLNKIFGLCENYCKNRVGLKGLML